jgi:SEC-C motif-containing protein
MTGSMTACSCGSALVFDYCCGPILAGTPAKNPEALMRSRYSAYVLGNMDHIDRTFAPEVRNDFGRAEAERTASETEWLGLEVIRSSQEGDKGVVEFSFRFRYHQQELTQHEVSTFRRADGYWLYVDSKVGSSVMPRKVNQIDRIGRNDPCNCGSGKKYKKCCAA